MANLMFLVTEDWYFVAHWMALAVAARRSGFQVCVATRLGEQAKEITKAGLRALPCEISRKGVNPLCEGLTVLRVARLLLREKPDLVHLVALKPVVLGGLAARLAGIPNVVAGIAGLGFLFAESNPMPAVAGLVRLLLPGLLGRVRVMVQNPEDASTLIGCRIDADRITLVRGVGVNVDRFRPAPEGPGLPIVMLPSRLLWDKGVGEFVEAAQMLKQAGVAARFVLVGAPDPDNPAAVPESKIHEWEGEGSVEWWGHRDDMPETLARAHLICLPSSYREGLPTVLLEAMACGRAIVTTDAPGCREAVQHGLNGLLVPVKDADALARAIRSLLEDPDQRRAMGVRGRERAEQEFRDEIVIAQTLAVYRELLE